MAREDRGRRDDRVESHDEQAAREAGAAGGSEISRSTGTGSAGSGLAAAGGQVSPEDTTTGAATDESGDLNDAASPSGARFGGTGTAGSGLGGPSVAGATGGSAAEREPSGSDLGGTSGAPGTPADKATTRGGSDAGGGGR